MCSALVGFAAMIATLPLPGYVTKHIQGAQREKMKRVSSSPWHGDQETEYYATPSSRPMLVSRPSQRVCCYVTCPCDRNAQGFVFVVMNVIRMVKLFGWEPRMAAQLDKKREEELVAVRRSKLLNLSINMCKYVIVCCLARRDNFTDASPAT